MKEQQVPDGDEEGAQILHYTLGGGTSPRHDPRWHHGHGHTRAALPRGGRARLGAQGVITFDLAHHEWASSWSF